MRILQEHERPEAKLLSMITLRGTPVRPGAAMGIGLTVGSQGVQSLPPKLIEEAARALKRGPFEEDMPQVILLCDDLLDSALVRIPGLAIAGAAARAPASPAVLLDVPSVAGVGSELGRAGDEEIVILDGTRGLVYIAPDAQTVERYERMLAMRQAGRRIFLGSEHEQARTMDGRIVRVAAIVAQEGDVAGAVAEGADELLVSPAEWVDLSRILGVCGEKSVLVVTDEPSTDLLRAALWRDAPGEVCFVLSEEDYETLHAGTLADMREVLKDLPEDVLEPAEVHFGAIAQERVALPQAAEFLIVWPEPEELPTVAANWNWEGDRDRMTLVVGKNLEVARLPIEVGLHAVAVAPGLVSEAKNLIRTLPPDYVV